MLQFIKDFLKLEAASSVALMLATVLALIAANTSLVSYYSAVQAPGVTHWINDGLMAIFFLLIGIEIKHEIKEGELSGRGQLLLPVVAALGGVVVPAVIFAAFNWGQPTLRGWAIPSATDIAFSLGVLALFGKRLTASLRIFLMAVAVIDDLVAVLIIALFYTGDLSLPELGVSAVCVLLLWVYGRRNVEKVAPYLLAGGALWVAMLDSGIHATIAGVILGLLLPGQMGKKISQLLHPFVAFGIIPLFAFANAGIPFENLSLSHATGALPLGIIVGLFAGKQIGIVAASWILVRLGRAKLPAGANWLEFHAVAILAGIGFTMSLFIGALAFTDAALMDYIRVGVMIGSLASAVLGIIMMSIALKLKRK